MMKKILSMTIILILAVSIFTGCAGDEKNEPEQQTPDLQFTAETLPRIDGATAQAPYYEAMAAALMSVPVSEARQYVLCNKTDGAYDNLIRGDVDVIFANIPSEEQKAGAEAAGFEFELTPFVNGGFVFFVNKDNPVESLTKQQLHDIYAGKITNWKEVGGNDVDIIAYQRAENSGSQTGIYEHIISKSEIMPAPTEKVMAEMSEIVDAVAAYENSEGAIGYSYYYYVANMYGADAVKLIGVEGVVPSDETISTAEYPITTPSFVIIRSDEPADSPARQIVQWVLSEAGQKLAAENGYVPRMNQ